MGVLDIVTGVGNLLSAPVKVLSDWASEPLKAFEANRANKNEDKRVERKIKEEKAISEIRRAEDAAKIDNQIKAETEKEKIRSEIVLNEEKTREQIEIDKARKMSEIAMAEKEHAANLQIKMQTEVNRINVQIEEMQKDRQIERGKEVLEAILSYQKNMAEFETFIMNAVGTMTIELQNRVNEMKFEWKKRFEEYRDSELTKIRQFVKENRELFPDDPELLRQINSECLSMLSKTVQTCSEDVTALRDRITALSDHLEKISSATHIALMEQIGNLKQISAIQQNAIATNSNIINRE